FPTVRQQGKVCRRVTVAICCKMYASRSNISNGSGEAAKDLSLNAQIPLLHVGMRWIKLVCLEGHEARDVSEAAKCVGERREKTWGNANPRAKHKANYVERGLV